MRPKRDPTERPYPLRRLRNQVAVLVGVNDYDAYSPYKSLAGSIQDVRDWVHACHRVGVVRRHMTVLTSPRTTVAGIDSEPAKRDSILEALRDMAAFLRHATATDPRKGVFVFAGHGLLTGTKHGLVFHLCPTDTRKVGGAVRGTITLNEVANIFESPPLPEWASLTVVLDCCFVGKTLPNGGTSRPSADPAAPRTRALEEFDLSEEQQALLAPAGQAASLESLFGSLKSILPARVVLFGAAADLAYEYYIGHEWRGVFSWAATSVLARWNPILHRKDSTMDLRWTSLRHRVDALTSALAFDQRALLHPDHSPLNVFQHVQRADDHTPHTAVKPHSTGRPVQLSAGVTGWFRYELHTQEDGLVGEVWATGAEPGQGLEPNSEYWDVDLSALHSTNFILVLAAKDLNGVKPPTSGREAQWRATLGSVVEDHTGALEAGRWAYRSNPNQEPAPPFVLLRLGSTHTTWVRESTALLFKGSPVGASIQFVYVGGADYPYEDRVWSQDPRYEWP